jgi:hypothetical protein
VKLSGDEQEPEYRVPAKLLTNRDPIILNVLSFRELAQWGVVSGLIYLEFNLLPLDFLIKVFLTSTLLILGFTFIHVPVNGLAGIEWCWVWLRFKLEKRLHKTVATPPTARDLASSNPSVRISLAGQMPESEGEVVKPTIELKR